MRDAKKILLIDDDEEVREVLRRFLSARGYAVSTASNGKDGLSAMVDDPPDLAFLDLEMPGLSGLDVLRWVEGNHTDVPIIAISGHPAAAKVLGPDSVRLGAVEFIRKPFDLAAIAEKLEERLGA